MIIVSQNKRAIVNFNNIDQIIILGYPTHDCEIVYYGASDRDGLSHSILGKYSFERAKEVLAEIVQKYSSYLQLNGGPAILQGQMDIQPNIFNIPKVYEMPEK